MYVCFWGKCDYHWLSPPRFKARGSYSFSRLCQRLQGGSDDLDDGKHCAPSKCGAIHQTINGSLLWWRYVNVSAIPVIRNHALILLLLAVLSSFAAKTFAKYTFIQNVWGSTEALTVPQIEGENEDYEYIHFDTLSTDGLKFLPVENTGYVSETGVALELYEFVHRLTPTSAPFLGWHVRQNLKLSSNESENPEWHTGDLWTPHPDPEKAAYAWKFVCRKDDLICFATGMNGHPAPIERVIIENPKVNAMVLVGEQHQQTLALIELAAGYEVTRELACEIWDETITQANEKAQVHMRVAKTHVLLVPFGSFETTPKGSVVRKGTVSKYRDVIEETYANFGDKWQDGKDRYGSISQTTSITVEIEMEGEEREEDEGEDKSTPTA